MLVRQEVIKMIELLPDKQLERIAAYIRLIQNEMPEKASLTQEQYELLDLLNYNIDSGRVDFAENHDKYLYEMGE